MQHTFTSSTSPATLSGKRADLRSPTEAAAYIGVSPNTLASWRHHGRYSLPFVRVGSRIFYRQADLDAFIERRLVDTGGQ